MRLKSSIAFFAIVGLSLLLFETGCRRGGMRHSSSNSSAETAETKDNIAASDATPDPNAFDAKLDQSESEGVDLAEGEEVRRSYTLRPGALVNIHGINGRLRVETGDTNVAEVLILRTARNREDLQYRKIKIDHEPDRLTISVENDRKSIFSALGHVPEGRQRVMLRLPKKVDFETNGVNGNVTVSEVQGRVEIRGVNGQVKVGRAMEKTEIGGINGGIDVTFAEKFTEKAEVSGVNGNIDLRFLGEANADLNAWGINGNVEPDLPKVERRETEPRRGRIKARIGNGGAIIEIHGVNGNVHLAKAEKASETTAKVK